MFAPNLPMAVSKNAEAERLVGKRCEDRAGGGEGIVFLDEPVELGYHCPVCVYEAVINENYDERLLWSEYEGFLWCSVCNRDYPSCLCLPGEPLRAVQVYLSAVGDAIERLRRNLP